MGVFGFLGSVGKGIAKGVGSAIGRPLRGIGRVMTGDFKRGFSDIGHGLKRGAQAAALLGSGGAAAPLLAAGGGMLERGLSDNASFKNVLGAGVRGASGAIAARGVGNIGRSILGRGPDSVASQVASGGGGGMPRQTLEALRLKDTLATSGVTSAVKDAGGSLFSGIGGAMRQGANFIEEHPASLTFAGNMLSETGYNQEDYYKESLAQRREEEEYDRSRDKLLRDMILSGTWRSR